MPKYEMVIDYVSTDAFDERVVRQERRTTDSDLSLLQAIAHLMTRRFKGYKSSLIVEPGNGDPEYMVYWVVKPTKGSDD